MAARACKEALYESAQIVRWNPRLSRGAPPQWPEVCRPANPSGKLKKPKLAESETGKSTLENRSRRSENGRLDANSFEPSLVTVNSVCIHEEKAKLAETRKIIYAKTRFEATMLLKTNKTALVRSHLLQETQQPSLS